MTAAIQQPLNLHAAMQPQRLSVGWQLAADMATPGRHGGISHLGLPARLTGSKGRLG